jgi:small-conductance mechanosensitive channel
MQSARHFPGRLFWFSVAVAMMAIPVWGQGTETTPWPVPSSPYEPGLMVLAVTAILIIGGAIVRLLLLLGLIRRLVWILPVLIFLTGGFWIFLRIGRFADVPRLSALIGFLLSFLIFVAILVPAARWLLPSRALQTRGGVPVLLRGMAVVGIGSVGMFVLLSWAFPGLSFAPVFITSGVVSIVMGLALQEALGNLMAGIVMSVERPFKIGDWIQVGTTEGEAVEQTWRATVVRTRAGDYLHIPNNLAVREIMVNFDRPTPEHLVKIQVGVSYDTPCGVAVESLLEAASKVAEVLRKPAPSVYLKDFLDSSILYELRVWIDNYGSLNAIESDVRKQIWYSFKRYGVTIPFPQRDVNIHRHMDRSLESYSRLVVTGGPLQGAMYMLGEAPATAGRAAENTLIVTDPHVSNHHFVIEPKEGGYSLRDLGSRYGTLLNGQLIESAQLVQGDEIRVGSVVFVYETHVAPVSVRVERRVVPAAPGRHMAPGSTVATSNTAVKETPV